MVAVIDGTLPLAHGVSLAERGMGDEIVLFEYEDGKIDLGLEEVQARALELARRVLSSLKKIESRGDRN